MAKKTKAPKKSAKEKASAKAAKKRPAKKAPKKKSSAKKSLRAGARKPKAAVPPPLPMPWRQPLPGEKSLGVVEDFYGHVSVIALTLQGPLKVGDRIHVRGHTTDMTETVDSLQIDHRSVPEAKAGEPVGVKTTGKCRTGDYVYRVG